MSSGGSEATLALVEGWGVWGTSYVFALDVAVDLVGDFDRMGCWLGFAKSRRAGWCSGRASTSLV